MNFYFVAIPVVGAGILGTLLLTNSELNKTLLSTKPSTTETNITVKPPKVRVPTGDWSNCLSKDGEFSDCLSAIVKSYVPQQRMKWKVPVAPR